MPQKSLLQPFRKVNLALCLQPATENPAASCSSECFAEPFDTFSTALKCQHLLSTVTGNFKKVPVRYRAPFVTSQERALRNAQPFTKAQLV